MLIAVKYVARNLATCGAFGCCPALGAIATMAESAVGCDAGVGDACDFALAGVDPDWLMRLVETVGVAAGCAV